MKKLIMVLIPVMLLWTAQVWASGLAIPEQGAAALGFSAAMTARSEDLSSIFYNPAGIGYVENTELYLGVIPIIPGHAYAGNGASLDAEKKTFLPPQLYAARRFNERVVLGFGVYAPFGLGTDWDETWNGRYTSTLAEIQCIYANPTIAYKVNDMISLGVGVSYVYSNATIEKKIDTGLVLYGETKDTALASITAPMIANTDYDSHFSLDGSGSGFGYNIGALITPIEKLQLGISYRGATDIEYEGDAKFSHNKTAIENIPGMGTLLYTGVASKMPATQDGETTLHLPWMLNLGAKYDITDIWDASVDFDFVGWSVYDELTIDFADDKPKDKSTMDKDWENSFVFRAGTSYDINESLVARGGFLFDQSPVPDNTFDGQLPDNDRTGISFGAGYKIGMFRIDASYMFLSFSDRTKNNLIGYSDTNDDDKVDNVDQATSNGALALQQRGAYPVGNGNFESSANLFAVSVSYNF
ncbi:OmpP1/FadL family transporter [Candidatus Latescibacterota bacterium]